VTVFAGNFTMLFKFKHHIIFLSSKPTQFSQNSTFTPFQHIATITNFLGIHVTTFYINSKHSQYHFKISKSHSLIKFSHSLKIPTMATHLGSQIKKKIVFNIFNLILNHVIKPKINQ
jgi:hypothetical protein